MLYSWSALAAFLTSYTKCPRCRKVQQFRGKKKGDTVICRKCGNQFVLWQRRRR